MTFVFHFSRTSAKFSEACRMMMLQFPKIVLLLSPLVTSMKSNDLSTFQPQNLQRISTEQFLRAKKQQEAQLEENYLTNKDRKLIWSDTSTSGWDFGEGFDPYKESEAMYAPSYNSYDRWSQAFRMLGGYIDCDHPAEQKDDPDDTNNGATETVIGCSRWMMWAAYVYLGETDGQQERALDSQNLDCGEKGSQWSLIGVYRQEFYQFIEQASKHMWAKTDARYITALAGLSYITKYDCQYVGKDFYGRKLYAGVQPLYGANFQMSLYSDVHCTQKSSSKYTYDDFFAGSDMDLNCEESDDWYSCITYSNNNNNGNYYNNNNNNNNKNRNKRNLGESNYQLSYDRLDFTVQSQYQAKQVWQAAQEYTLTNLNKIYQNFTSCTYCMDYPTYQDGFFNGNSGYGYDDLINQCWKFYSHNSYTCNGDCQTMALKQGTVWTASANKTFYENKATNKAYVNRGTKSISAFDQDNFVGTTFLLSSALLFTAALATYYYMGGTANMDAMCADIVDAPCTDGCGDDSEIQGEYDHVQQAPWYAPNGDVVPPPPPPRTKSGLPPPPPSLSFKTTPTKSMDVSDDDHSPSKDALLPTSPVNSYGGNEGTKESDRYEAPRYMYSMD